MSHVNATVRRLKPDNKSDFTIKQDTPGGKCYCLAVLKYHVLCIKEETPNETKVGFIVYFLYLSSVVVLLFFISLLSRRNPWNVKDFLHLSGSFWIFKDHTKVIFQDAQYHLSQCLNTEKFSRKSHSLSSCISPFWSFFPAAPSSADPPRARCGWRTEDYGRPSSTGFNYRCSQLQSEGTGPGRTCQVQTLAGSQEEKEG